MTKRKGKTTLTAKQKRFVEEYLIDLNATQAAIRAGYLLRMCGDEKRYYVYLLTDSRNGEIFYVGKGLGQRFAAHEREWRVMEKTNPAKCKRIDDVISGGGMVIAYCLADGLSESAGFRLERALISEIGLSRL